MQDTAHYVRIQKAFLDENKSAVELAKIADSSFYNSLNVVMKEVSNGTVINTIPLTRVDMNLEGFTKADGTFFTSPNYGYKFKFPLNSGSEYRLVIENAAAGIKDSSQISVLNASDFLVGDFFQATYRIR